MVTEPGPRSTAHHWLPFLPVDGNFYRFGPALRLRLDFSVFFYCIQGKTVPRKKKNNKARMSTGCECVLTTVTNLWYALY